MSRPMQIDANTYHNEIKSNFPGPGVEPERTETIGSYYAPEPKENQAIRFRAGKRPPRCFDGEQPTVLFLFVYSNSVTAKRSRVYRNVEITKRTLLQDIEDCLLMFVLHYTTVHEVPTLIKLENTRRVELYQQHVVKLTNNINRTKL